MWCTNCRQDVPGIASQAEAGSSSGSPLICIRCGAVLPANSEAGLPTASEEAFRAKIAESDAESTSPDLPTAFDSWELEERLRHVKRVLAKPAARESRGAASRLEFRIDAGQASDPRSDARADTIPDQPRSEEPYRGSWASLAAWSAITVGLAALTCGGVLSGWSLATGREELWTIGPPVLLGGQMTLVIGLLLQLRRIWRQSASGDRPLPNRSRSQATLARKSNRERL